MTLRRAGMAVALAATLVCVAAAQTAGQNDKEFQAALQKEMVAGDVKGAIADYQRIAARPGVDRALAAETLLRLAGCYVKLGDAQASEIYERIVRDYGDQARTASRARALLDQQQPAGGPTYKLVWRDGHGTSVSADGRYVPVAVSGGLVVRDLQTGTNRTVITTPPRHGDYVETAVISRDGEEIAYSWSNGQTLRYELRVVSRTAAVDSTPRVLLDNPEFTFVTPFDWSPDGRFIAVRLGRTGDASRLALVDSRDRRVTWLQSLDWSGPKRMVFSPDGAYIAYDLATKDNGPHDIVVRRVDGTAGGPIAPYETDDLPIGWSADGRRFLFASNRTGGMALFVAPIDGTALTGDPAIVRSDLGAVDSILGLTRSGSLLLAQSTGMTSTIHAAEVDWATGQRLAPPVRVFQDAWCSHESPHWSWDGARLAYRQRACGNIPGHMVIHDIASGRTSSIRAQISSGNLTGWAPDGTVTMNGFDLKGRVGIFRIDPRDGAATTITTADAILALPSWSADGTLLAFRKQEPGSASMMIRDMRSGEERVLLRSGPRSFGFLRIAPDGRHVAFLSFDGRRISVIPVAGGEPREIVAPADDVTWDQMLEWLPDSSRLLVGKTTRGQRTSWVVSVSGAAPVALGEALPQGARIHPDGRRVVYGLGGRRTDVWRLDNFLPD